jgi:hypothetical protein
MEKKKDIREMVVGQRNGKRNNVCYKKGMKLKKIWGGGKIFEKS